MGKRFFEIVEIRPLEGKSFFHCLEGEGEEEYIPIAPVLLGEELPDWAVSLYSQEADFWNKKPLSRYGNISLEKAAELQVEADDIISQKPEKSREEDGYIIIEEHAHWYSKQTEQTFSGIREVFQNLTVNPLVALKRK